MSVGSDVDVHVVVFVMCCVLGVYVVFCIISFNCSVLWLVCGLVCVGGVWGVGVDEAVMGTGGCPWLGATTSSDARSDEAECRGGKNVKRGQSGRYARRRAAISPGPGDTADRGAVYAHERGLQKLEQGASSRVSLGEAD